MTAGDRCISIPMYKRMGIIVPLGMSKCLERDLFIDCCAQDLQESRPHPCSIITILTTLVYSDKYGGTKGKWAMESWPLFVLPYRIGSNLLEWYREHF